MPLPNYQKQTFVCGECGWSGPGVDCSVADWLDQVVMIACPYCEARIRIVPLVNPAVSIIKVSNSLAA